MTPRQRLLKRIGKLQRMIGRTEKLQRTRRDAVRRLREGDVALYEFITNRRIDHEPTRRHAHRLHRRTGRCVESA
jgi:hypothetical protein